MAEHGGIPFIVEVEGKGDGEAIAAKVPVEALKKNLQSAIAQLGEVFQSAAKVGQFRLTEVELGVEIGAQGGVHFIGTATVKGGATIKLTFEPPEA